jgi:toxin ParE1/3/4
MVQVTWAQPAVDDLRAIHDYIAQDSPRYARIMVKRLQDATWFLARFPEMGQKLVELPETGYREHVVGMYRLIYREDLEHSRIVIVGVIHGSRDLSRAMKGR